MHFTVTQLGLVSECPGVTCTGRAFPSPVPVGAKDWVTSGEGYGSSRKLFPLHPATSLPAAQLNLWTGKGSSLQKLLQDPLLLASEKHQSCHWSRPSLEPCDQLLLALWQQRWDKGAETGAGGPGRLRYHSAASAGQGYVVTSTSSSGLYSLDFIWTRKC